MASLNPTFPESPNASRSPTDMADNSTRNSPGGKSLKDILKERSLSQQKRACLPCRERKVRCNRGQPCQVCLRRGHVDLCSYQTQENGPQTPSIERRNPPAKPITPPKARAKGKAVARSSSPALEDSRYSEPSESTPLLLGNDSIADFTGQEQDDRNKTSPRQMTFEVGMFPKLGCVEDAAYYLTADGGTDDVDGQRYGQEAVKLFETYRSRVHPFHFLVYDLDAAEKLLVAFFRPVLGPLQARDNRSMCLLHAILASGAQFTELPPKEKNDLSRKHASIAFGYIRTAGGFINASKETLQSLLILSHVLQNDWQLQAAWMLGGTILRMAYVLGLHKAGDISSNGRLTISEGEARFLRRAIVKQDGLLSSGFSRPNAAAEFALDEDYPNLIENHHEPLSYEGAIAWSCHLLTMHSSPYGHEKIPSVNGCLDLYQKLEQVEQHLSPHLQSTEMCSSVHELQEHFSLELNKCFILSTSSRPILANFQRGGHAQSSIDILLQKLQTSLKNSAWAFVRIQAIGRHISRSWPLVHSGLSSVLLLSLMKETNLLSETKQLQTAFITGLGEEVDNYLRRGDESALPETDRLFTLQQKVLNALQAIQRLGVQDEVDIGREAVTSIPNNTNFEMVEDTGVPTSIPTRAGYQHREEFNIDSWIHDIGLGRYSLFDAVDTLMADGSGLTLDPQHII